MENLQNLLTENENEVQEAAKDKEEIIGEKEIEEVGKDSSTGPDSDSDSDNEEEKEKKEKKEKKENAKLIKGSKESVNGFVNWCARSFEDRNWFGKSFFWFLNHVTFGVFEAWGHGLLAPRRKDYIDSGTEEKWYFIAGGHVKTGRAGKFFYSLFDKLTFGLTSLATIGVAVAAKKGKEGKYAFENRGVFGKALLWFVNHLFLGIPECIAPAVFANDGCGHTRAYSNGKKKYGIAWELIETCRALKFLYSLADKLTFGLTSLATIIIRKMISKICKKNPKVHDEMAAREYEVFQEFEKELSQKLEKNDNDKDKAIDNDNDKDEAIDNDNDKDEAIDNDNDKDEAIDNDNDKDEAIDNDNDKDEAIDNDNDKDEAIDKAIDKAIEISDKNEEKRISEMENKETEERNKNKRMAMEKKRVNYKSFRQSCGGNHDIDIGGYTVNTSNGNNGSNVNEELFVLQGLGKGLGN